MKSRAGFSPLAGKTVAVTGATGLIGSHLCAAMPDGMQMFTPGRRDFAFPCADIIIHAAGCAQPARFMDDPVGTVAVNTEMTAALLEKLRPGGSFVFCSSSEVYSGLSHPASEDDIGTTTPQHPRACYIEGKRCGEAIVNAYRKKGVRASSARIALTYGPGTKKHDTRVINQLIEKALTRGKIDLVDSGNAIRTFCYVSDTAELLWDIALLGTQAVYNVGGTTVVSIAELAQKIADKLGVELRLPESGIPSAGAAQEVRLNTARVREEFGKTEYVGLDEGLEQTIAWQKELYR
jgi:nucleoside-diphosphate-sugar epimerase